MKRLAIFTLFFAFLISAALGETYTWVGGFSNNWNDEDNWKNATEDAVGHGYPGENPTIDTAIIDSSGVSINISSALNNLSTLTIEGGASLTLSGSPYPILSTATITNIGNLNLGSQTVTATTIINNGTLILEGDAGQLLGGTHTSMDGTVVFTGSGTALSGITDFFNLTIQSEARTGVGTVSVSGDFYISGGSLNAASLSVIGTGTIGGDVTTTGNTQDYRGNVTLGANVTLTGSTVTMGAITGNGHALTIAGNAVLNGGSGIGALQIDGAGNTATINGSITNTTSVTINAAGTTTINAANITTTGTGTAQHYYGPVVLGANVTFTGAANSTVQFHNTVNDDTNARTLTVAAANVIFDGVVGGDIGLGRVIIGNTTAAGTTTINAASITTLGTATNSQYYYGPVVLNADVTFTGASGTIIRFNNTVNGAHELTVTTATARFNAQVGETTALTGVIAGTTRIVVGVITTGDQTYSGAVTLGSGTGNNTVTLVADAGNWITFGDTVNSNNTTERALIVTNANVRFGGTVGTAISTISVNGNGNTEINTASITTMGAQTYTGTVTLGGASGLRTLGGTTVTMGAITGDDHPLTITGNAVFNGVVNGVTTLNVSETSAINTASITTTGAQTYTGAVTLGANVNLSANAGDLITFGNTVNGAFGLTVTDADVQFINTVGGTTYLANVNVTAGSSTINASITTTGTQIYTGAVTLGGAAGLRTLTGTTVTMGAITGDGRALTVAGNAELNSGGNNIGAFQINGNAVINGDITTTGNQFYTGAITLGGTGTRKIESTGGSITTGTGPISASDDVIIKASNGITIGSGGIAVTNITLESGGAVTQVGSIITGTLTLCGNVGFTLNNAGNNIETLQTLAVLPNIYPTIISYTDADDFKIGTEGLQAVTRVALITAGKVTIEKNINIAGSGVVPGNHKGDSALYIEADELEGDGAITFTSGSGHWVCAYITQSTGFAGDVNEDGIHYHTTDGRHIVYRSGDSSSFISSLYGNHPLFAQLYLYIQADNANLSDKQDIYTTGTGNIYIIDVDNGDISNHALTRDVSFNTESGGHIEIWGKYTTETTGILTLNPGSGGVVLIDAEINLVGNFSTNNTPLTAAGTSVSKINAVNIILGEGIEGVSGLPNDLTLAAGTIHITGTAGTPSPLKDVIINGGLTLENTILSASSFSFNNGQVALLGDVELDTNNGDIEFNYNAAAPSITGNGNLVMTAGSGNVSILGQAGQSSSHIGDIHIISAGDVSFSNDIYAEDISINNAGDVSFSRDVYSGDISVNSAGDVAFSSDVNAGDISINNADDVTFSSDINAGDISVNNAGDVTFSSVVSSGNITINNSGLYTQNGNVTVNGNFNQTGNGDVELGGGITINNTAEIGFVSKVTLGSSIAFNAPVGGTVKLKSVIEGSGSYTLTLSGGSAVSPLLIEQINTSGIEIDGSLILAANSYVKINNGSMLTQNDGKGLTLGTNAVLDTSAASLHMGSSGTSDDFAGINGALNLGAGSKLTVNTLDLTGSSFEITNTDWVTISVKGSAAEIGENVIFSGDYARLIIEMNGDAPSTAQVLRAERILGSLHIREHSRTVLSTDDASQTVSFMGEIKIFYGGSNWLDAGGYDIVMYAGLTGNRNLTNYTHNGSDSIRYTRWENVNAPIAAPPYSSPPDMNSFVFKQNTGGKVSFQREPGSTDPVFIEIAGNTMWREFVCSVPGAVVQFSRHPNHHVVLEDFSIGNKSSTAADHSDYVTITRLTDGAYINFPYIYDSSIMGPPPLTSAGASVGDLGNYALPVYYPPLDLKNAVSQEKEKYWNINFISVSGPAQKPLDNFRYVKIFFSHAYNQRIPIETSSMHLDAVPYYRALTGDGHFNFDWIELRKILYSFTEDSSGDGRLDRIRVQTNVRLNGDFSAFEVNVEGYKIDPSKGINGFRMVSDLTGYNDDEDSFYIYLQQVPQIDSGSTPLWSVTRNESLKDLLTESSAVGDPEIDVDMIPFDTIPVRIAYTLTLPGHPQTYVRMSEPALSLPGGNIGDTQAVERSESYIFTWKYFPYDSPPVVFTLPVISANMGYLLNMPSSFDIETLARLKNLFGDTTSSETDGYFRMDNIIDQGQRAMDWHDPSVDPAFYIYYQPPKYPLNWGYTEYAKVYGNSHLAGRRFLTPDFSLDDTMAVKSDGSFIPLSDVFLPPNKMLTVEMMTLIARGDGDKVTPQNFAGYSNPSARDSVIRRVTDVLVSLAPAGGDSENYFAWPVWARYQNNANPGNASLPGDFWSQRNTDNGVIWTFDGTDFLEARGFELQARMNSGLTGSLELFWTTDIPTEYRIPREEPVRGRSTGGLWLPYPGDLHNNRLLYYFIPMYGGSAVNQTSASAPANPPLFNFALEGENSSGKKMEFVFRINGISPSDLFIARLDIPRSGAIPENWYYLVRPFGFDIQDIRLQRGGVTVLNNVINSDARESAFIRYHIVRPGRVTVQVYTLDGTLVKSLRRNEYREAGEWTDAWDGTNNSGRAVARGMYFVRVVAPDIDEIRKVMVVR